MNREFDVNDLARAVQDQVRKLMGTYCSTMNPHLMLKGTEQARALLRIEATPEAVWMIHREAGMLQGPTQTGKPLQFMGVSLYEVRHALPPCGWNVINPLA